MCYPLAAPTDVQGSAQQDSLQHVLALYLCQQQLRPNTTHQGSQSATLSFNMVTSAAAQVTAWSCLEATSSCASVLHDLTSCLAAGQDVISKRSIGIHCCTMTISIEPLDEAPKVLEKDKRAAGIPKDAFITLQHGALLQTADGVDLNKPSLMNPA